MTKRKGIKGVSEVWNLKCIIKLVLKRNYGKNNICQTNK